MVPKVTWCEANFHAVKASGSELGHGTRVVTFSSSLHGPGSMAYNSSQTSHQQIQESFRYSIFKVIFSYDTPYYVVLGGGSFGGFFGTFEDLDFGRPDVHPTKAGTFLGRFGFPEGALVMTPRAKGKGPSRTVSGDNRNNRTRRTRTGRRGRRRWWWGAVFPRRRWGRRRRPAGRRGRRRFFGFRRFRQRP